MGAKPEHPVSKNDIQEHVKNIEGATQGAKLLDEVHKINIESSSFHAKPNAKPGDGLVGTDAAELVWSKLKEDGKIDPKDGKVHLPDGSAIKDVVDKNGQHALSIEFNSPFSKTDNAHSAAGEKLAGDKSGAERAKDPEQKQDVQSRIKHDVANLGKWADLSPEGKQDAVLQLVKDSHEALKDKDDYGKLSKQMETISKQLSKEGIKTEFSADARAGIMVLSVGDEYFTMNPPNEMNRLSHPNDWNKWKIHPGTPNDE